MQYLCLKYSGKVFETFFYIKKCNKFFKKVHYSALSFYTRTTYSIRLIYITHVRTLDKISFIPPFAMLILQQYTCTIKHKWEESEMKKDDYGFYGKGIDGYVHY